MTEHSCLRCRDYLEKQQEAFRVRQELELRLMVTECIAFGAVAALVLLLLFGGG